MRFKFSFKTSITCLLLAIGMLRLAYWQWNRHLEKKSYIATLEERYNQSITTLEELVPSITLAPQDYVHRQVKVSGEYDFAHEVYLKSQRHAGIPGVHVITPLKVETSDVYILVNRGFVPLNLMEQGKKFHNQKHSNFIGLIKETKFEKFLAPKDPETGPNSDWVSNWLRINVKKIDQQLPYSILPVYLEIVTADKNTKSIVQDSSGKEELLFLPMRAKAQDKLQADAEFPIPVFSTVLPPGRHFGYVIEWSLMAFGVLLTGLLLQMRKRQL